MLKVNAVPVWAALLVIVLAKPSFAAINVVENAIAVSIVNTSSSKNSLLEVPSELEFS